MSRPSGRHGPASLAYISSGESNKLLLWSAVAAWPEEECGEWLQWTIPKVKDVLSQPFMYLSRVEVPGLDSASATYYVGKPLASTVKGHRKTTWLTGQLGGSNTSL